MDTLGVLDVAMDCILSDRPLGSNVDGLLTTFSA